VQAIVDVKLETFLAAPAAAFAVASFR